MRKVWLTDMRHPEVARLLERPHIGVLPIGSTEQHGPHLPLDVDTRIAAAMCEEAALRVADEIGVAIAPLRLVVPGKISPPPLFGAER